ncbi:hypothetical protein ES703_12696 [subsurface metagenome]
MPAVPEVKQPWQMTKEEWLETGIMGTLPPEIEHRGMVHAALREGKPVPAEVLKDYPDLVELVKPPAVSVVEYDRRYTLEELREMARREGLSPSGSKKEIAARLIAKGVT